MAAYETGKEGYIIPVLVGNEQELRALAEERGYDTSVFTFVDINDEDYKNKVITAYVQNPKTMLKEKALGRRMQDPLYYAMAMQVAGEADVTFAGIENTTGDVLLAGQMIIGLKPGISTISSIGLADIPGYEGSEGSLLAVGDSAVCTNPTSEQLASIAISACDTVKELLDWEPRCAMSSYTTLGSGQGELIDKVTEALKVAGKANVLIWPDLNVGNTAVKLIQQFGHANAYGPMLQGFNSIVCDCSRGAPVSEIKGNIVISAVRAAGGKN